MSDLAAGAGCGCGQDGGGTITNPPGQAALAYRSGTHASILRQMLARLQAPAPTPVSSAPDDPGVALLDAWATVADIVTFYQERIANEGYLRTATERRSVLELARAIGYELRPGAAAVTYLDFRVQDAEGAPTTCVVAKGTKVRSVPAQGQLPQTFETSDELVADVTRNEMRLRRTERQELGTATTYAYLSGVSTGLRATDAILVVERGGDAAPEKATWDVRVLRTVEPRPAGPADGPSATYITWDKALSHDYQDPVVYALRLRTGLFGRNAPDWRAMPDAVRERYVSSTDEDLATKQRAAPTWPDFTVATPKDSAVIDLDGSHPGLAAGSWLVLQQPGPKETLYQVKQAALSGRQDFAMSGPTTRVTLDRAGGLDGSDGFDLRQVWALTQTDQRDLAEVPIGGTVTGQVLDLDSAAAPAQGRPVVVRGLTEAGATVVKVVRVTAATAGRHASITVKPPLRESLLRESVRLHGNVVEATHGETVPGEALGSGDASTPGQSFTLARKDLTYVAAETPRGVTAELTVLVDKVLWQEVPSLFGAGPQDRCYVIRVDDDARATVTFGDGQNGARLTTGQENVRATYRSGLGLAGLLDADSLTLLPQRPLGISDVTNPVPATGGEAPETLAGARENAPAGVLTLDRVVSVRDYEDYARTYPGIAKARAVTLQGSQAPFVHLTVLGPDGAAVGPATLELLRGALESARNPVGEVQIAGEHHAAFVTVGVKVLPAADHDFTFVRPAVRQALLTGYGTAARSFGEPLTASGVLATVHRVDGVAAALVTALYVTDAGRPPTGVREVIPAADAHIDPAGGIVPAELLLVDPGNLSVTEMTP